jgi:glycosyltransferase involved in cell wall biosynthesis
MLKSSAQIAAPSDTLSEERLLLVGSYPPPFGGVSSFIVELEKGLTNHVSQFYVMCFDVKNSLEVKPSGAVIHRILNRPNRILFSLFKTSPIRLMRVLLKYGGVVWKDVRLYTSGLHSALLISCLARKNKSTTITVFTTKAGVSIPFLRELLPDVSILYCVFADPYKNPKFYAAHNGWYREAMKKSNAVFSSSCYCAAVTKLFDQSLNPSVIYIGVDTEKFHSRISRALSRQQLELPGEGDIVLAVARMEPEMGIPDVLEIARLVHARNPSVIFVIAGARGAASQRVQEAAKESNGRIVCRIDVPGNDLPKYYSASTLVIAPTVGAHACMGVSVKEAMASGRPVIVSNSGGLPEAVRDGENGRIVPLTPRGTVDVEKYSDVLCSILTNRSLLKEMGDKSRLRALELFDSHSSVNGYMKLLHKE